MSRVRDIIIPSGGGGGGASMNVSAGTASSNLTKIVFADSNGVSFGLNGSTITASAAGAGAANIKLSAGTTTNVRTDFTFANSNGVSFGLNNGTLTATVKTDYQSSGAYLTTAMRSDAVTLSNVKFSAGTLSALRSDLTFSNSNGVSFGLDTNGVLTATVKTDYLTAQTVESLKFSAGTLSALRTDLTFSNANGLSFGLDTNGVITGTVQTNYLTTQTVQPAVNGISAGTTSTSGATVKFADSNGVSFGLNGSVVTATVKTDYLTNQSAQPVALSGSNGSFAFSTATFGNLNGLSFYTSNGSMVGSYTVPSVTNSAWTVSDNATSGTVARLAFTNLNGITLSLSTGAGGSHTVVGSYTVPTQTNQTLGLYAVGNTTGQSSSSTFDARTLSFDGAGVASVGFSAGSIVVSVPSGGGAGDGGNVLAAGTRTATTLGTVKFADSNGISFNLDTVNGTQITASYTVPTVTNSSWTVSDAATSGTVGRLAFTNLNGITLSLSTGAGGSHTIVGSHNALTTQTSQSAIKGLGVSNTGNTAGNTGLSTGIDWVIAGSNNITVSESTAAGGPNTIWINQTGGGGGGITNINLSAGTTSNNLSKFVLSNSNGVSFGLNGSTVTADAAIVFSAGTSSAEIGSVVFSDSNGIGFGLNGSTITASAGPVYSLYNYPQIIPQTSSVSFSGSTQWINPISLRDFVTADYMRLLNTFSFANTTTIATTANATGSCQLASTVWAVLYTLGTGASSHSLQSVSSWSVGFTTKWSLSANANGSQWTLSQSITHPITGGTSQFTTGVTTSLSNYSLGSVSLTAFTGHRWLDFGMSSSLTPGVYWMAFGNSSATTTGGIAGMTNLRGALSSVGVPQISDAILARSVNPFGQGTASSNMLMRGLGSFSTNVINSVASLDLSNISSFSSHPLMFIVWEKGV